ncbi:MAG: ribokinase [Clostridia bacterium]|jgi:ribokinase|nr:ribokinase [Clostridia bacterium]
MNKVIVVGSLNIDMVAAVNGIPKKGETVLAANMEKFDGGKGANQAVASSRFGASTAIIGAVGNDEDGKALLERMKSKGVDVTGVSLRVNDKTGTAWITVDQKGENSIVVISGANRTLCKEDIDANEALFKDADIVLLQLEIPMETVTYAMDKAKENGCKVILNPAPAAKLSRDILSKTDYITPNESELDILAGGAEDSSQLQKAQKLIDQGVANVICTLGKEGAMLVNQTGHVNFPTIIVDAVDTTGAGDCFNGVLAAELANNISIENAIKTAVKAASFSVTKKGAQSSMPSRQDVENTNYKLI